MGEEKATDPELEQVIERAAYKFIAPPPSLVPRVQQTLNRRKVEALVRGDYSRADLVDRDLESVEYAIAQQRERENEDRRLESLYQHYLDLEQKRRRVNGEWDQRIEEHAADERAKREALVEQQRKEQEAFDEWWSDPSSMRPYSKPSQTLQGLRSQERAMAVCGMYREATEIRSRADRLEKEETREAQAVFEEVVEKERRKLGERQAKELGVFDMNTQRVRESMEKAREREIRPIAAAIQQIRFKKGTQERHRGSVVAREAPLSPRTTELYASYKTERGSAMLKIRPLTGKASTFTARKMGSSLPRHPTTALRV